MEPEALATACTRALDAKQAEAIVVLCVAGLTSIADYFVIAAARNPRQLRAISNEVQTMAHRRGIRMLGVEGTAESGWILIDLGDVVVHLFDPLRRALYSLEVLWGDAPRQDGASVPTTDAPAAE